ncbi:MAG: HD-GYP domain-containing protein [Mobilitalea sp.]
MIGAAIKIGDCKEGDILGEDVLNQNGIVLVSENTILTDYIIIKLVAMDIKYVRLLTYENDNDSPSISLKYHETLMQIKNLLEELAAGKQLDYKTVNYISNSLNESINDNGSIVKHMQELRSADEYTYTHSLNTAIYSMLIGRWLSFSESDIVMAIQSGLLHDIGKAQIPPEILNKKGILTNDEYDVIKNHTIYGFSMLDDVKNISSEVKQAVLHHHERSDGSGYPFKATTSDVNIFAKIVAISDVFDAMTSDRVYKKRATPFDAFEMFYSNGMGVFDTKIMTVFTRQIANYYVGMKVVLTNGKIGEIVFIPPYDLISPIINVENGYIDLSRESGLKIEAFL